MAAYSGGLVLVCGNVVVLADSLLELVLYFFVLLLGLSFVLQCLLVVLK